MNSSSKKSGYTTFFQGVLDFFCFICYSFNVLQPRQCTILIKLVGFHNINKHYTGYKIICQINMKLLKTFYLFKRKIFLPYITHFENISKKRKQIKSFKQYSSEDKSKHFSFNWKLSLKNNIKISLILRKKFEIILF